MRILLIDTCGEIASLALADEHTIVASVALAPRTASAEILVALRSLVANSGWKLDELYGVGVVNGPGSFTGVRVGVSCAKGLCEALSIKVAAVSRLQVLASTSPQAQGFAVLAAGRDQVFVRNLSTGSESLETIAGFCRRAAGLPMVVAEEQLLSRLEGSISNLQKLDAAASAELVFERLMIGGDDLELIDANYVRDEANIYGKALR